MYSKKSSLAFLIALFVFNYLFPVNFIFDLDGVLLKKDNLSAFWQIGPSNLIGFYNPFTLEARLFEFYDLIQPRTLETPLAFRNGQLMPALMCDWLTSKKSCNELLEFTAQGLSAHQDFFYSKGEQRLIEQITKMMFTPNRMAKTVTYSKKGLKLLKKCYRQQEATGKKLNRLFILSNWDKDSFECLVQTNRRVQKILSYCDGYVISGIAQMMKPQPDIFEYLFNKYTIDPDNELTIYIDDSQENIVAANQLKHKQLIPLHCKNFNFKPIKKVLRELRVI
jgi:FMN phosphatase YigB (HAD superfamily)